MKMLQEHDNMRGSIHENNSSRSGRGESSSSNVNRGSESVKSSKKKLKETTGEL